MRMRKLATVVIVTVFQSPWALLALSLRRVSWQGSIEMSSALPVLSCVIAASLLLQNGSKSWHKHNNICIILS